MNTMQMLIDGMNAQMMRERATTQLTLGEMIAALEAMPEGTMVAGLNDPHSYRGYYSDLAFQNTGVLRSCEDLLAECKAAMGQVFTGYKGGKFVMGALTPVWISPYGFDSGDRLMSINPDGTFETEPEED